MSWIGFGNGLAGNVAAVLAGGAIDRCFRRRLKLGIVVGLVGCCLSTGWFMLQVRISSLYVKGIYLGVTCCKCKSIPISTIIGSIFIDRVLPLPIEH